MQSPHTYSSNLSPRTPTMNGTVSWVPRDQLGLQHPRKEKKIGELMIWLQHRMSKGSYSAPPAQVSFKRDLYIGEKRRIKERYNRDLKGDLLQDV